MTTPPSTGTHGGRRWWPVLAASAVVALVPVVWWSATADGPSDELPLQVTAASGLIHVSGGAVAPRTPVAVSVELPGGSGAAAVLTDADGEFSVVFRPAGGTGGRATVTAESEAGRWQAETDVAPGEDEPPATDPAVVPMTGAPAPTGDVPDLPGFDRADVPEGIPADCSEDVTADLNRWLGTVPDSSQVVFPRSGCYWVDGSIELNERRDLVIEGNGSRFEAQNLVPEPYLNRARWWLNYSTDITLRDMVLVGVNATGGYDPDYEYDHSVFIRGAHSVTIDNVHGLRPHGDFVAIAHGKDERTIPSDISIRNSSADTVGRQGVSCVACDGVTVEGSVFNNIAYHVFDLEVEGDDRPGRGVAFVGNTVQRHGYAFFSIGAPFQTYGNDISDVRITGNTMTTPSDNTGECLPAVSMVHNKTPVVGLVIEDNVLVSHTDAIALRHVSQVTVQRNTARFLAPSCDGPAVAVRASGVSGATVRHNELSGYATEYAAS